MAVELAETGVLDKYGVLMIGANLEAIKKAEDRQLFSQAMTKIGVEQPQGGFAYSMDDAWNILEDVGFPAIIRPSFTLGGTGGGIAYNREEYEFQVRHGLELSPITEVLVEESLIGWKEFELEVMRDLNDNVVIICTIENFDPMGVHTGDSITVAPIQTLTDREYQQLRDWSIDVIREIGVETGGSNIQFAQDPRGREGCDHRDESPCVEKFGSCLKGHGFPRSQRSPPNLLSAIHWMRSPTILPARQRPVSSRP